MSTRGQDFTKTRHSKPYAAISPSRPELSQAGKTVLVTGGTAGIGYAIARGFLRGGAAKVIILGRTPERATAAATALRLEAQEANQGPAGEVVGLAVDIADSAAVESLWAGFGGDDSNKNGTDGIDVLVLNAAGVSQQKPVLELGTKGIWRDYEVNVRAQLDMTERFYKQSNKTTDRPLYLIHVSTSAIHDWSLSPKRRGYAASKLAGATALQMIALETPARQMQILNFNPGPNYTQSAKDAGYTPDDYDWYDLDLAGHFAVWCASPEAAFLHGRFVWSSWDVDELRSGEIRKRIDEDEFFLMTGVQGI